MADNKNYWDISSEESVDGLVLTQTNPFYPNISATHNAGGDIDQYRVTFNQGYVFNRVSEKQVSDIADKCKISKMDQTYVLDNDDHKKYYAKVTINSKNFLIHEAEFVEKEGTEDAPETDFPALLFGEEDPEKEHYVAFFPLLELKNGSIIKYTQRNNIFLSDRQFQQLGEELLFPVVIWRTLLVWEVSLLMT